MSAPTGGRGAPAAAAVGVSTLLANVLVYGVYLVLARALPAADLGAFSALNNLVVIASVPALALQLVTARHVARATPGAEATEAASGLRTGALVGAGGTLVLLALSPVISAVLDLPGPGAALLLATVVLPTYVTFAAQGALQGRHRFAALGVVLVAVAAGRFAAAVVGGALGFGVTGVLGLTVVSAWLAAVVALWLVRGALPSPRRAAAPTWVGAVLHSTTATSALLVATNLDTPLARALLPATTAGEYAVVAVLGKAAYWGPAFLSTLFYPRMATATGRRTAVAAVGATTLIGAGGTLGAWLLARPLVVLVGGSGYAHLAPLVPLLVASGAVWSVAQVLVYWRLSRGDHRLGWVVWVTAALVVAAVAQRHDGIAEIASSVLAGGLVVVAWGLVLLARARRSERPAPAEDVPV